MSYNIITVGLAPCWDVTCHMAGWQWNAHRRITRQEIRPAGKALNVSRVLVELGTPNTACGLWGDKDYPALLKHLEAYQPALRCRFTLVPGHTRTNVTLIETQRHREAHLRASESLVTTESLQRLQKQLAPLVRKNSICIFSGSLPAGEPLDRVLDLIDRCRQKQARMVIDTSGPALKAILDAGKIWLAKPNVEECAQLTGKPIKDTTRDLIEMASSLSNRPEGLLISRGENGAILVTSKECWVGKAKASRNPVLSSVACGDYLLAGFIHQRLKNKTDADALKTAIQVATLRAWGRTSQVDWIRGLSRAEISIKKLY